MQKIRVKPIMRVSLIVVLFFIAQIRSEENTSGAIEMFSTLTGPYLGQEGPGAEPELFAPGVISRQDHFEHSAAVFSPDLSEVFWSAKPNGERYYNIYFMEEIDEKWTTPKVVPFIEKNYGERGPVFSPDGHKLYLNLNGDIWITEKRVDGWSEPALVSELSDPAREERICGIANDGSFFFTRTQSAPRIREFYVSRITNEGYSAPEKLDKDIPTGYKAVGDIFISPDKSYMILELHVDEGTSELFVSYRIKDGSWSDEIKLPLGWARCPSVSPDGKYIFFMRREGIYWADAGILQELKPTEAK